MGMEQYMGYPFKDMGAAEHGPRELPKCSIVGTLFYVDIQKGEFRQVDDRHNRISLGQANEENGMSHFYYDTETKNLYLGDTSFPRFLPKNVLAVIVPPLKLLDPAGLARRQGQSEWHSKKPKGTTSLLAISPAVHQRRQALPKRNRKLKR